MQFNVNFCLVIINLSYEAFKQNKILARKSYQYLNNLDKNKYKIFQELEGSIWISPFAVKRITPVAKGTISLIPE